MFKPHSRFTQCMLGLALICMTHASVAQETQTEPPAKAPQSTARPATTKPLADSLAGAAKAEYDSAKQLIVVGDYENALVKFQRAYELSKDHRLLWNIAVCENKLRHYTKARETLREYRERGAGKLTPDEIEQLDALDDTLSKLITNVQIDVNESGVTLVMDDRQVGTAPFDKPLSVDVGKRIFRFEKPGFKPVTIEQTMVGGSSMTLTIKLEKEIHEGKLIVDAGAKDTIILDGKTRGLGHFEGILASGGYTLRVTAPGMLPFQTEVFVKDNDIRRIPVTLHPAPKQVDMAKWGWIGGGTVLLIGAFVAGAFMFTPTKGPSGTVDNVQLGGQK